MKKLLSVLALVGTGTVASLSTAGCGSAAVDNFYEPQVTMPIVYLQKGHGPTDLNAYIKSFISVTFAKEYANTQAVVTVDSSSIKIDAEGYYSVNYTVRYGENEKSYEGFVSVVDRLVVMMNETSKISAFTPKINMESHADFKNEGFLVNFMEGVKFQENGVDIPKTHIQIDDSTVRYAVPGTHLVKFTLTSPDTGYKSNVYREVKINEAETPNKVDFEKYFQYRAKGLTCDRWTTNDSLYPEHLMIPSKYIDENNNIVDVTRKENWGCDFKDVGRDGSTQQAKDSFKKIRSIIMQDGHSSFNDSFISISRYTPNDGQPNIEKFFLPETIGEMTGSSSLSGTNVKTLILPRSLKYLDRDVLGDGCCSGPWEIKNLVVLGMPVSNIASDSFGINTAGAWFEKFTSHTLTGKSVYFHMDYMMGTSKDGKANNKFAELWKFAKESNRTRFVNSFANYNKIIID